MLFSFSQIDEQPSPPATLHIQLRWQQNTEQKANRQLVVPADITKQQQTQPQVSHCITYHTRQQRSKIHITDLILPSSGFIDPISMVQNTRTSRNYLSTYLVLFYACVLICIPNLSLIDRHLEVTQKVAVFPICGLWQSSILTNVPTVCVCSMICCCFIPGYQY